MAYRTQKAQRIPFRVRVIFRDGDVWVRDHQSMAEAVAFATTESDNPHVLEVEIENDGTGHQVVYDSGEMI